MSISPIDPTTMLQPEVRASDGMAVDLPSNEEITPSACNSEPEVQSQPLTFLNKLMTDGNLSQDQVINLLTVGHPSDINQYSEHIFKLLSILHEARYLLQDQSAKLIEKLFTLFDYLLAYESISNPLESKLYLIIQKNFDILIKVSVDEYNFELSTKSIRFLTRVMMLLNYWEVYNLLSWKPAIYHFLTVIQFDLNECYMRFIKEYTNYNYQQKQITFNRDQIGRRQSRLLDEYADEEIDSDDSDRRNSEVSETSGLHTPSNRNSISDSTSPSYYYAHDDANEGSLVVQQVGDGTVLVNADGQRVAGHRVDGFINNDVKSLAAKEKKRITIEPKLARRIIKRANSRISAKSSNYDPDVIHECQLSSADEPGKMCLRRFSRKYELIRHQETVHSKKKKLFKCFVCVKQNPGIGPRIFTRHDTLAKHIRVNHKISGKDAKAEVAFSKRHAEVVEEGDITVHVGRRKTKVDFELRAHMEKKRAGDDGDLDYSDVDVDDTNNSIMDEEEDDEMDGMNDSSMTPEATQVSQSSLMSQVQQVPQASQSSVSPNSPNLANSLNVANSPNFANSPDISQNLQQLPAQEAMNQAHSIQSQSQSPILHNTERKEATASHPATIKVSKQPPSTEVSTPYYHTEQVMDLNTWNMGRSKIRFHQEQPGIAVSKSIQLPTITLPSLPTEKPDLPNIKHLTPRSAFINKNKNNS